MTGPKLAEKRPQPVITPQAIIASVTFVAGQAVAYGVIPEATSSKVLGVAPIVVSATFAVVAALHGSAAVYSARKVTPNDDPTAVVTQPDGSQRLEPLVPLSLAVQATPNTAGIEDLDGDFSDLDAGPGDEDHPTSDTATAAATAAGGGSTAD